VSVELAARRSSLWAVKSVRDWRFMGDLAWSFIGWSAVIWASV
jgi:hypothetical protein